MSNYYNGLKAPKASSLYTKMRGVADFGNLGQYDLYEGGYGFIGVINGPSFMKGAEAEAACPGSSELLATFINIIENEFRGLDGLPDMETENGDLTDGISTMSMITKVTQQTNAQVTMRFFEKSGGSITRFIKLFLRGLKDPRSQYKTYNGLLDMYPDYKAEYSKEVFNMIYLVTDNTGRELEAAYLLLNMQPTKAQTSIYNVTKGEMEFKEIDVEFNCFPIEGPEVNRIAKEYLAGLNGILIKNSGDFNYSYSSGASKTSPDRIQDLSGASIVR